MDNEYLNRKLNECIQHLEGVLPAEDALEIIKNLEAMTSPTERFMCTIEGGFDEACSDCVLDNTNSYTRDDCCECTTSPNIKSREDCEYWKSVKSFK